jgi:hypothetical protein
MDFHRISGSWMGRKREEVADVVEGVGVEMGEVV